VDNAVRQAIEHLEKAHRADGTDKDVGLDLALSRLYMHAGENQKAADLLNRVLEYEPDAVEEVFGPVAPIIKVRDKNDALAVANSSEMGLTGYVYTGDLARGLRVCERLDVGMVGLNRGLVSDPAAPFGGVKQSGIGREGAHEGLLEFTETKYIATSW